MSYSIPDLIIDLVWGASEMFFGKRKGRTEEEVEQRDEAEKSVAEPPVDGPNSNLGLDLKRQFIRTRESNRSSPNPDALLGLEIKLVTGFDAPGVVPTVDIAQRAIDAEARRRMEIGRHLLLERLGAGL